MIKRNIFTGKHYYREPMSQARFALLAGAALGASVIVSGYIIVLIWGVL